MKIIIFSIFFFFINVQISFSKSFDIWSAIEKTKFESVEQDIRNLTIDDIKFILSQHEKNRQIPNFVNEFFSRLAMFRGEKNIIHIMLEAGADVNYESKYGTTILKNALLHNQSLDFIKALIEKGAKLEDASLIISSTRNQNYKVTEFLLKQGFDINFKGVYGFTPLISVIRQSDNVEDIKWLVALGANLNTEDSSGKTPLMHALRNNNLDIARYLIEAGADVTARDNSGNTALIQLVKAEIDAPDIVKMLIERGVDVEAKSYFCNRAIDYATLCNLKNTEEILLKKGVKPTDYLCSCEELDDYWHGNSVCPYTPEQSPEEEKTFWQTIKEKVM